MNRPSLFFVEYQDREKVEAYLAEHPEDPDLDGIEPMSLVSCLDGPAPASALDADEEMALAALRALANVLAAVNQATVAIFRRDNLQDVTPEGDPPGLLYDWEIHHVEDVEPASAA